MGKERIGLKIWRVAYPIGIYTIITFIVGTIYMIGLVIHRILYQLFYQRFYDLLAASQEATVIYMAQTLQITLISAVIAIPVLLYFKQLDIKRLKKAGFYKEHTKVSPKYLGFLFILGISSCIAGNNLITISGLSRIFSGFEEVAISLYRGSIILELVAVGVMIPIAEELIFRVLGFRRIREYSGFWPSALLSSFIFGVYHGNLVQGIYAFILALLLCYAYEKYQTMAAPMLVHMAANGASVLISETNILTIFYENTILFYLLTFGAVLFTAVSIYLIKKYVIVTEIKLHEEVQL